MDKLASQIIVDILMHEMCMPENSVWLRNQGRQIPNDKGLYIVVGATSLPPYANATFMQERIESGVPVLYEVNEVNAQENISIDILSRSNDALTRNWEITAAMQSFYAQQQMELYRFKIARIPRAFVETSGAEGGSMLNRYSITIPCLVWYRKEKKLSATSGDYYDDFTTRVDDDKSIGTDTPIIEFEINSEGIVP